MSVRAKKHLGQHFLKDERVAKQIAESLSHHGYDQILEIGPGMGILTKYLLRTKSKVTVMELDSESVDYLNYDFKIKHLKLDTSPERFQIIGTDFLKHDIQKVFGSEQFAIIGNYPYNISSQIVFKTLENKDFIPEFSGMFQKEVAKRITAREGSKIYGILSVLSQAFYDAEYLFTVPASVFNPPPKVESGVIRLTRKKDFSLPVDETLFFKVVKMAFNQRRKMLRSSLKSFNLSDSLKEDTIFAMRPEQLSVHQFVELTQKIASHVV